MVTGELPVEVNVTGWIEVEFTVTSPKLTLAGLIVSCGLEPAAPAVPIPLRLTTIALPVEELLLIVICPDAAPAFVGSN